ncbi:hypothetical protein AOB46_06605 [Chryseobacterium indologenes]|uniref:Shikimate kinase n=2 Tax=Chryseobacterium indologenes TaxID=253 RepID=A0A0N0IX39_CHRID|nr:hypothetical protein AOB46_06605 [Chryseobacterium indologenes]
MGNINDIPITMKYIKNRINVILTLQISEPDLNTSEFAGFKIVNCYELLEKYNYCSSQDSHLKKLEYISEEIINSEDPILICNTGLSTMDFDIISGILRPHQLIINKILIPTLSKRNRKLAEGQEAYRNHSRWLHFYPGEIEDIYNNFEEEIKDLKTRYENTGTEIQEI